MFAQPDAHALHASDRLRPLPADGADRRRLGSGRLTRRARPRALHRRVAAGLEQFSHIEIIYVFDRVDPSSFEPGARRPRNNPDWPAVGVFAQRNKRRPNRIGVSTCELTEIDGTEIVVRGLDAIHSTPVLDIKPYMKEFAPRGGVRQPAGHTSS